MREQGGGITGDVLRTLRTGVGALPLSVPRDREAAGRIFLRTIGDSTGILVLTKFEEYLYYEGIKGRIRLKGKFRRRKLAETTTQGEEGGEWAVGISRKPYVSAKWWV